MNKVYLVYFENEFNEHYLQSIFDSEEKAEKMIIDARERRIKDNHYLADDSYYVQVANVY
jgi:hypothetical protein